MKTSLLLILLISSGVVKAQTYDQFRKCKFYFNNSYVLSENYSKLKASKIMIASTQSEADHSVKIYVDSWSSTCTMLGITYYSCKDYKAGYIITNLNDGQTIERNRIGEKSFNKISDQAIAQMKKLKCFND